MLTVELQQVCKSYDRVVAVDSLSALERGYVRVVKEGSRPPGPAGDAASQERLRAMSVTLGRASSSCTKPVAARRRQ